MEKQIIIICLNNQPTWYLYEKTYSSEGEGERSSHDRLCSNCFTRSKQNKQESWQFNLDYFSFRIVPMFTIAWTRKLAIKRALMILIFDSWKILYLHHMRSPSCKTCVLTYFGMLVLSCLCWVNRPDLSKVCIFGKSLWPFWIVYFKFEFFLPNLANFSRH